MKSRKGQLVCQHLENISRKALENYQNGMRGHISPGRPRMHLSGLSEEEIFQIV